MTTIKHILIPVEDIDAAVAFWTGQFGLTLKFRDGDRYAALDGGGITVSLTAQGESLTGGRIALSVQVEDVDAFLRDRAAAGVTVLRPVEQGPHERRAVLADPSGHPVVVSSRNKPG
jgi:predicted enzyme related to lactoylglutathione lyase